MKKHLAILSLAVAGLCAVPFQVRAQDVPPKPPGGDKAPPPPGEHGDKPGGKPRGDRPPGGRMNPEERLKLMTEKLGLTPEQQEKIKAIHEKNAPQMKELMDKGRENLSEADRTKLRELRKGQQEEIAAVLTPEQREKMKELRPAGDRKPGEGRHKPDAK